MVDITTLLNDEPVGTITYADSNDGRTAAERNDGLALFEVRLKGRHRADCGTCSEAM
jgi:hypothetical protein